MLEVVVTDEDKSFDFLGKSLYKESEAAETGFNVNKVFFSKDKYIDSVSAELRDEILERLQQYVDEVKKYLINANQIIKD